MKNFCGLIAAIVFFTFPAFAQLEGAWTLDACIKHALQNNIQIRQSELQIKSSKNNYTQSYINFLPNIDGSINYNFSFGNTLNPANNQRIPLNAQTSNASLSAAMPLFTGLQQIHNVSKTKYDLLASQFDYESIKQNIALNVTSSFLQLVLNSEIIKVAEAQKNNSEEQYNRIQALVKSGMMAEANLFDVQAQLARDQANLTNAKNNLELARVSLQILLQLDVSKPFEAVIPENLSTEEMNKLIDNTPKSVFDFASTTQPSIKSAEARIKSSMYSHKIAIGSLFPTLSVFGNISTNYFNKAQRVVGFDTTKLEAIYEPIGFDKQLQDNFQKVAGFNLSVPIFQGWQRMTNVANSKLGWQSRILDLENSKNQLKTDVYQAYFNAVGAAESYLANKKSYEASKQAYEATYKRLNVGLANQFEYEQSRNNMVAAQSQMIQSKYTYIFRSKVLDFYMGKPITLQ